MNSSEIVLLVSVVINLIFFIVCMMMASDLKMNAWTIKHLEGEVDKWFGYAMRYSKELSDEQLLNLRLRARGNVGAIMPETVDTPQPMSWTDSIDTLRSKDFGNE